MLSLIGCGGHAKSILSVLDRIKKPSERSFYDDCVSSYPGMLYRGKLSDIKKIACESEELVLAIGDLYYRQRIISDLAVLVDRFQTVIDPTAQVCTSASIGRGVFVGPGAYIGPDVTIDDFAIVNTRSVIEHDCIIGKNVHIAPGAVLCGGASVRRDTWCGAGSVVIQGVVIECNITLAAGAVAVNDLNETGTYTGVPAKLRGR